MNNNVYLTPPRCGKCMHDEVEIKINIQNNIYPSWVLDVYKFLQKLPLHYVIIKSEGETFIDILNIPDNLQNTVFEKTKELGLILEIKTKQKAVYSRNMYRPDDWGRIIGFNDTRKNFIIREAKENEDINHISYTLERKI